MCDLCGVLSEEPVLNVGMRVILNCTGVPQQVKVDLHYETIAKLIPVHLVKSSLVNESSGAQVSLTNYKFGDLTSENGNLKLLSIIPVYFGYFHNLFINGNYFNKVI